MKTFTNNFAKGASVQVAVHILFLKRAAIKITRKIGFLKEFKVLF